MTSSATDRELNYHLLKFLESLEVEDPSKKNTLSEVTQKLSKLFEVNTKSVDDYLALDYYDGDLTHHVKNGVQALGAGHFDADLAEAKLNERYAPFAEIIASRKYFDGCEEGTFEYLRRQSRVLSKFREKYPKTDLPLEHPEHPLRLALGAASKAAVAATGASSDKIDMSKSPEKVSGGAVPTVSPAEKPSLVVFASTPTTGPVQSSPAKPSSTLSDPEPASLPTAPSTKLVEKLVLPPAAPEPVTNKAAPTTAGGNNKKKKGKK